MVFLLQQLSGCYTVIFYAVPVFQSLAGTGAGGPSQVDALITMGVVRLLTSVVACALSFRVGRRPLLIGSSLAMACSAVLVALTATASTDRHYYYYYDNGDDVYVPLENVWPLIGVTTFVCSGSAGVLVFPWTLVGELLPVSVRAVAGAVLVAYAYALMFVMLKAFPYLVVSEPGDGGGRGSMTTVFVAFAAISMAMAAYVHARLPETLGKRFDEIEEYFADPPPSPDDAKNPTK